jgi:hypothetical protein
LTVYGPQVAGFVASLIPGCARGFGECQAVGFVDSGKLVAGVVYHNWNPESGVIELSAASVNRAWLTKERLSVIFEYPFGFCRMVLTRQSENNARALRIWRSLGGKEYRIPDLRGPGEAEIIFTLSADDWRAGKFKGIAYGQAARAKAT